MTKLEWKIRRNIPEFPIFTLVAALLLACGILHGQTFVSGGYISGSWSASDSPYFVQGDLLVHADSTLAIGEGTQVLFTGPYWLEVQGQLLVFGTDASPVIFDRHDTTEFWRGIYFNTTDTSITDSSLVAGSQIFHCLQSSALYLVESSRVRISACTIGKSNAFRGGGIRCFLSSPRIEQVIVDSCRALDGGGIFLEASSPAIRQSVITRNRADGAGGGLVIFSDSDPLIEDCLIIDNESYGSGGGLYVNQASPVFRRCNFRDNEGAMLAGNLYSGGGVSIKLNSYARYEDCIFENNHSHREGGAMAFFSPCDMVNCLFSSNSAEVSGGAIHAGATGMTTSSILNSTLNANESLQGSAVSTLNHTIAITNSILWHADTLNTGSMIYLNVSVPRNVLSVEYSGILNGEQGIERETGAQYTWGVGNIEADPLFETGSYELAWNSPCIEAGTPDTTGLELPLTDLMGNPRIVNERIDLGGYEYQAPVIVQSPVYRLADKVQRGMKVYPNPATNKVVIETAEFSSKKRLELINYEGSVVYSSVLTSRCTLIHTGSLPPGFYLVRITGDDISSSRKLIIR